MSEYELPNGREIYLKRWAMQRTYEGLIEGSRDSASEDIRENINKTAAIILSPADPLIIVELDHSAELPDWICVAQFSSLQSVQNAASGFGSRLYVCWFMQDTTQSLDGVIKGLIPYLDWESRAADFDSSYFRDFPKD